MNRAKLRWTDGHEELRDDIDPTATRVNVPGTDGRFHTFNATEAIDEDGCDIFEEEPPADA